MTARPTFLLFNTSMFKVAKVNDEIVMGADPHEQARVLCAILVSAVPSAVCREFLDMLGGSYGKLIAIGNSPDLHQHHTRNTKYKPLTLKQKAEIRRAIGPARIVAARHHVHKSTVYRLRKEA